MYQQYLKTLESLLESICEKQRGALEQAAGVLADVLKKDGLIYLFGCGHSHMLAEEGFYRAGGLGAVYPVFQSDLMLHEGAVKSSALERKSELASEVFLRYPMTPKDALIVFSNSGINGFPVELARLATERGVQTIGVSSSAYDHVPSRHPLGKHLAEVCLYSVDTGAPHGDACYRLNQSALHMGPVSTILSAYVLNCMLARAAEIAMEQGCEPAVYVSGNVEGGREMNEAIIQRYRHRIRAM